MEKLRGYEDMRSGLELLWDDDDLNKILLRRAGQEIEDEDSVFVYLLLAYDEYCHSACPSLPRKDFESMICRYVDVVVENPDFADQVCQLCSARGLGES